MSHIVIIITAHHKLQGTHGRYENRKRTRTRKISVGTVPGEACCLGDEFIVSCRLRAIALYHDDCKFAF